MKRLLAITAVLLVALSAAAFQKGTSGRLLTGKVFDRQENVLPNSVVYLSDSRTRAVKTYIVGPDGTYRFPALSNAVDYEVYAQYNGKKSETKMVSQFDNRQQININLKIDTR